MTSIIAIEQVYRRPARSDEEFDAFLDRVLDEFYKIDVEADYLADMEDLRVEWTITVDAEGLDALIAATSNLRTALHAAECATADWITLKELKAMAADDSELSAV